MKMLLSFALLLVLAGTSYSQSCGSSGPGQCTLTGAPIISGIYPPSEDILCIVKGQPYSTTLQYRNLDTMAGFTVDLLRIDSITNLPSGICWKSNKTDNTFLNYEHGCLLFTGTTNVLSGQYKTIIYVTITVGGLSPISGELSALAMQFGVLGMSAPALRVVEQSFSPCPPVDSTQTNSNPFIPYIYETIYPNVAEVKGKMFFDANQNHVLDSLEQPVRNQLVEVGNNWLALTNQSGNYHAYPASGTLTIKPSLSGNMSTFAFNPDSISITADSGISYLNNDFGIIAPPNFCEGRIAIVTTNPPPRPGFNNSLTVRFTNVFSAVATSQDISFTYDAHQTFVSANPAPATVDTANRTLTWNTSNINSGSSWQAIVTLRTPQTVAMGTVLNYSTWVSSSSCSQPDVPPNDDEESIVDSSHDPNDKSVSPVGEAPGGRILPSTSLLSYTIRFQNTGTYLAENVNVVDTISSLLDLSTLRVQAASHNYEVIIRGREVTFRFSQINLPDSNSNEPMSHGYIKYSIKPTAGFVQNSVIQNRADIYFDFNSPVRTNTVTSTADNFVGIGKVFSGDLSFEVYPNPLSEGNWQLVTDGKLKGKEAKIYNAEGKLVQSLSIINAKTEIDASRFSKGVYIIRIGNSASRVIKL